MRILRRFAPPLFALALPLAQAHAEGAEAPPATGEEQKAAEAKPADAPPPQVNAHLQAAKRLYQKLDLDAAMAELKEAENDARAKDNEDQLVQVLIYKGLIFADLGKANDMSEHFKRALAMRPWAEMPPETSPRIAKQFADSRRELWGSSLKAPPKKRKTAAAPTPPAATQTTVTPPAPVSVTVAPETSAPPPAEKPAAPAEKPAEPPAAPASGGLEPPK
ncbi:MAG: hypothetical protein JST92_27955 [Deltaproteobacteria bacterium]|nr:hypothetical protein [Deltaproteobacteria bacterium]